MTKKEYEKFGFDKMRSLRQDLGSNRFSFKCVWCGTGSDWLRPKPIGEPYKPYQVIDGSLLPIDNSDLEGAEVLPDSGSYLRKFYDKLPTIRDALLFSKDIQVEMECMACESHFVLPNKTDSDEFKRFVRWCYPEDMVL